jgi:hypothetical protein
MVEGDAFLGALEPVFGNVPDPDGAVGKDQDVCGL